MKIRNQARLCRAVSDFEPQIMFSICLDYHGKCKKIQPQSKETNKLPQLFENQKK